MRKLRKVLSVILAVLMTASCVVIASAAEEETTPIGSKGNFNVLSYNVAGLPIPSSETEDGKDAYLDTIEIGKKINAMNYDIVAVQEDFNYDLYLREQIKKYDNVVDEDDVVIERHQTVHSGGVPLGDGLNIFSSFAQYNEARQTWEVSAGALTEGSDELTYKGILLTTVEVIEGYYVDIYNIHADAYGGAESLAAREAQMTQLAEFIKLRSKFDEEAGIYEHAVILTGDFNVSICNENAEGEAYLVQNLLEPARLNDAWAVKTIASIEENPADYTAYYEYAAATDLSYSQASGHYDSVERICYANGNGIDLTVGNFSYFYINGADGESLSDHPAVEASFTFEIVEKTIETGNNDKENVKEEKSFLLRFLDYIASIFRTIGKLLQDWANWL